MSAQPPKSRGLVPLALIVLAVAFGGYFAWRWYSPGGTKSEPDMVAVHKANLAGVALMEQFDYQKAIPAFEKVVEMAPNWLPGRINLGIALYNTTDDDNIDRASQLFQEVLQKEPDNPYAHHNLGVIADYRGKMDEAARHFEAVVKKDPTDAYAWVYLGKNLTEDEKRAAECFEKALQFNPYLNLARYKLWEKVRFDNPAGAQELLNVSERLREAKWAEPDQFKSRYSELGPYAEVIGAEGRLPPVPTGPIPLFLRDEKFQVRLAAGARWATRDDLRKAPHGELRAALRARFGATLVVLDYNRDGKPDVFLVGAVVENGQVRDLLLRNDGNSVFTDVTAEAGLAAARPGIGCCVADFDNDGLPELFLTGVGEQHLFRNSKAGRFEDVTAEAGLDAIKAVCLGATFVDLDQDADLDLIVSQYAATPEAALALLAGEKKDAMGAGFAVYLNVGEAPAVPPSQDPWPLKPRFRRLDKPADAAFGAGPALGLTVTDLDADQDLDLVLLADQTSPAAVLNDRLLRFRRTSFVNGLIPPGTWNGALVLDVNHDRRSDLFLVGPGQRPLLLLNQAVPGKTESGKWYEAGAVDSPPLLQAWAMDMDLDSWTDVVGLTKDGKPLLLHNDGRRLQQVRNGLGLEENWPKDLVGLAVADFNDDCHPNLLVWSESGGLHLHAAQRNGHHALKIELVGHKRAEPSGVLVRCNAEGFGTWVFAHAGTLWTGAEYTTLTTGPGQSLAPLVLGLGKYTEAEVVRFRWPDLCIQAELNKPICQRQIIQENNRKQDSCPVLFTWDGERFVYVTDFLGAGTVGETAPDGTTNTPRPEESVKIEAHQLRPRNGEYVLKVAEPMQEVTFLDRLQLIVLDHPPDRIVYPDERFVLSGPQPTQDLLVFRQRLFPTQARDHRGGDVTKTLRKWDRDTVRDFDRRTWIGFAEEHWVKLDFGDQLAKFGPNEPLFLCLAGWTDYPYPDSLFAANQAGIASKPPVLERLTADGKWEPLGEIGFPAGLPRMMTCEVTGKLAGPRCVVRLRTNMCIYWDQIFVAPLHDLAIPGRKMGIRATPLEIRKAELASRGFLQEYSPDGRQPTLYDYDRLDTAPVARMAGRLTRLGDVTELLQKTDDCFALFGPGDEVTAHFDARGLPELPAGWTRSFVLRSWGYCKGCGPFTATGATIEPLPFRGMSRYPYGTDEHYPDDAEHANYLRSYNTRQVGKRER